MLDYKCKGNIFGGIRCVGLASFFFFFLYLSMGSQPACYCFMSF